MAINIMSDFRNKNEQNLVSDLIKEAIEQRGTDIHYILRTQLNTDYILGESSMSDFTDFFLMPMYLESMEHYDNSGMVWDGFGRNNMDAATFQVSTITFKNVMSQNTDLTRPREGDLIYLPFADSLWEITLVKTDQKYKQTGINHSWRLICKLFSYSHENIESNTETDFNSLGTQATIGILNSLGLAPDSLMDETELFKSETAQTTADFDPNNPFNY